MDRIGSAPPSTWERDHVRIHRLALVLSEDGSVCHIHERYRDDAAAMAHLGTFGSKFAERILGCVEPTALYVYGDPGAQVRAALGDSGAVYFGAIGGLGR